MDINKHIIDQRIRKIVQDKPEWFAESNDENYKISKSFVLLTVSTYLNIELAEAFSMVTDGGGDAGIDAIYLGDTNDLELPVTIFQGKYVFNLDKESNYPANSVLRVIHSIGSIFDPSKEIQLNPKLKPQIDEIRSLISDGYIPVVKIIFFNNGLKWNNEGEQHIVNAGFPRDQVEFEYINHQNIVDFIQSSKEIKASFRLTGESVVESFNFKRVLIGKVNVAEIAKLFQAHGDGLLERNIRRYLGLNRNRVNEAIQETLLGDRKDNFYFKNNGITMICKKFSYNALQEKNWDIVAEDFQIINGGQTCKTIQHTVNDNPNKDFAQVFVLVRLYELSDSNEDTENLVNEITLATNSQNPVDLSDLRANDTTQRTLETDIKELGYNYRRKKDIASTTDAIIPLSVAAQAVYSIWKNKPHVAKFKRKELFGSLYDDVFRPTPNAAQVVIAVLIYRYCDTQRRKTVLIEEHPHIPYSNYFLSMIIGQLLLKKTNITLANLTHKNFEQVKAYFDAHKDALFNEANTILTAALNKLYNEKYTNLEMSRLSAAFRRGDLLGQIVI
ncbi:MAG: AIPR family protein [Sediminibacterium sp.]|nr:AIPR family protein [Sediminibacterium sp.]